MERASVLARAFYGGLISEVTDSAQVLPPEQRQELQRYYHRLVNNPERRPFYRYNWIRRTAPVVHMLQSLPKRGRLWRVLDAGCGVGTESIFWATLREDVQVVGVDISTSRLEVARARVHRHERILGRALKVCFLEQDVFATLDSSQFDVVWTMEAISHIDPAEKFLVSVHRSLDDSGHIAVSDSHILNPVMAWRLLKLRWQGVSERSHKTLSTGNTIRYAQERLLTVGQLSRMLKRVGFTLLENQLSVFFPPAMARFPRLFRLCQRGDVILDRMPLLRNLGGIYTLIAVK